MIAIGIGIDKLVVIKHRDHDEDHHRVLVIRHHDRDEEHHKVVVIRHHDRDDDIITRSS